MKSSYGIEKLDSTSKTPQQLSLGMSDWTGSDGEGDNKENEGFQPEKKKMHKGLDLSLKSTRACMLYRPGKVNLLCYNFRLPCLCHMHQQNIMQHKLWSASLNHPHTVVHTVVTGLNKAASC